MAGKERSGYSNAAADLYRGASMIFTPYGWTDSAIVERLKAIFGEIGFARFVVTSPARHDEMIAYTSQLAHVVSSAYVRDELSGSHLGFSAGSYKDMTRVAWLNPQMWAELFLENRENLLFELGTLIEDLTKYKDAIERNDFGTLRQLLDDGRRIKEEVDGK